MRRIFLVAGEPSGDLLGAGLMRALRAEGPVAFEGVGGPLMEAEGLRSLFPISDIAVIGVFEVLPRLFTLLARIRATAAAAIASRADALVTIDSPGFCLRVTPRVRARRPDLPVIHYVAPSVWAWRPGRAKLMAGSVDHVLALLPFEPPYMQAAGMGCDFVGHPVAALLPPGAEAVARFRAAEGLGDAPLLAVLPGSRASEVARLAPVFGAALALVLAARPDLRLVVPAAGAVAEEVVAAVRGWPVPAHVLDPRGLEPGVAEARKFAAFAASSAALAASGTVALELAAMGCPMVTAYRLNHLTSLLVRHLLRVNSANLVNLLTESRVVPELLQEYCTPQALAAALMPLLTPGPEAERQREAGAAAMRQVGRGGRAPSVLAAEAVLRVIAARQGRLPSGP